MDSDEREVLIGSELLNNIEKLFIEGISQETTDETHYFGKYGELSQAIVIRDKPSGRSRGFGIVIYADPSIHDRVLQGEHIIDGRIVETSRILPRIEEEELRQVNRKTKDIFFDSDFPTTLTENELHRYFESYGDIIYVELIFDRDNQPRPRVFGFVAFESKESVDSVLEKSFHDLNGNTVQVWPYGVDD